MLEGKVLSKLTKAGETPAHNLNKVLLLQLSQRKAKVFA